MNSEELFSILRANGLNAIRIRDFAPIDSMTIDGDLEDFINAAKALNENVVFVNILRFENNYFIYDIDIDEDEYIPPEIRSELRDNQPINLSTESAKIRNYEKYVGNEAEFLLSILVKNRVLQYRQPEKWWLEFQALKDEVIFKSLEQKLSKVIERKVETSQKDQVLLNKLYELSEATDFINLATRKNTTLLDLQEYAKKEIPELKDLSEEIFKRVLPRLRSEIRAQKYGNK